MRTGRAAGKAGRHAGRRAPYPSARPGARIRTAICAARTRARIAVFVVVFVFANLAGMSAAFGDGEGNSGGSSVWRWMDVEDSHGNSAWGYSMSLDYGGITDVGNAVFGGVTGLCWFFYQWFVIASIWLINFALSMEWFDPLRAPAEQVADSLQVILAQAGLAPVLLAITAVAAGLLIMKGAWATAIFEVIVALVVLSLGTGILSNPVDKTVGATSGDKVVDSAEGSGWLAQATGAGLELAGGLQKAKYVGHTGDTGGFDDPDQVREDISGQLVDTFLRTPHQLINYGKPLDGTDCEGAYERSLNTTPPPQPSYVSGDPSSKDGVTIDSDKVPEQGEPGWTDWEEYRDWLAQGDEQSVNLIERLVKTKGSFNWTGDMNGGETTALMDKEPREIVGDCDEAAGEHAENPSPGMAGDAATMGFGVIFLVGLAAILAFTLIFVGVEFLWCALRSIWDFVIGLLPGRSRHALWQTLATAVWCLIGTAFTSIFLVTYLLILNEVATAVGGASIMGAFALVDILMLVGMILFWRLRKRMHSAAARTASLLAKRPNPDRDGRPPGWSGPAKMPAPGSGGAGGVGIGAAAAVGGRQALRGGKLAAAGTAGTYRAGASGVGKAGRVGGAIGAGAVLGTVGGVVAVGRKTSPFRRNREAMERAQGQFAAAGNVPQRTGAETNGAAATNGARPHASREGFSDERGIGTKHRRPHRSARTEAMSEHLRNAQTAAPPQPGGPEPQGEYRRVRKNGQTLFVPKVSANGRQRTSNPTGAGTGRPRRGRDRLRTTRSWVREKSAKHGARAAAWGGAVGVAYTSPSPSVIATVATASFAADVTSQELKEKWGKKR